MVSPRYTVPPTVEPALELVRKYNVPGPRYTSYPTAPQFSADVDRAALRAEIARDNADPARPLSLYFHLPFCESLCWYCGCNTVITRRRSSAGDYVDLLTRELAITQPLLNARRPVTQLHFGGGTPTFLPPAEIDRMGRAIHSVFTFAPDAEISVEIDPRRLTKEHVEAYRRLGCNRASLGVQDTNPEVQLAIHRWQPLDQTAQAITWLREAGYQSVSVDLIYGLPLQTPETFAQTLTEIIALNPDRLAVFSYAHVPWIKPAQKIFDDRGQLPTTEAKLAMLTTATRALTAAGYVHIGMDHFARPDDELAVAHEEGSLYRNFQGYTTRAGASLYGFGMSSISQTDGSFRQNHKNIEEYEAVLNRGELPVERGFLLSEDDRNRRAVVMDIMCRRRFDFVGLGQRLGLDVAQTYAAELATLTDLEADGLLRRDAGGFDITPLGELFRRVIAMRFDAYLDRGPRKFSSTV
ncbi:Oxygen-independent coproporphyrinogen-III oxidase [Lacunisphaera limnophila]|uniref:Coproporphyrinogen-III oxidase n=1 Tax=Lacunisphaera limnophila TaxID=1838286 RepID=A0A1D8AUS6_9BACT|nr:oxygen-independent coproporphyrinogen III oxidase [Lacunisphaera limnophila]AOS44632.1 Oxygen-independent coproporphyrinogen-III oxidase [Lacunisphaera limnophila]